MELKKKKVKNMRGVDSGEKLRKQISCINGIETGRVSVNNIMWDRILLYKYRTKYMFPN